MQFPSIDLQKVKQFFQTPAGYAVIVILLGAIGTAIYVIVNRKADSNEDVDVQHAKPHVQLKHIENVKQSQPADKGTVSLMDGKVLPVQAGVYKNDSPLNSFGIVKVPEGEESPKLVTQNLPKLPSFNVPEDEQPDRTKVLNAKEYYALSQQINKVPMREVETSPVYHMDSNPNIVQLMRGFMPTGTELK